MYKKNKKNQPIFIFLVQPRVVAVHPPISFSHPVFLGTFPILSILLHQQKISGGFPRAKVGGKKGG